MMNKIKKLVLITVIITINFLSTDLFAQDAIITGTIIDTDGEALFATNVIIDAAKGRATQSDFDGKYSLTIPAGHYFILYSYIGKENKIEEVNLVAGETKNINITLLSNETELGIVTVTGGKYEKKFGEEVVSMEVLPSNMIENSASQADEALTKVPGYTKIGDNASIRGGSGFAGGASSRVMVLVDGMPSLSAENGTINFANLPIENLQQVEVIKGASSAMYGSSALNGIINFRTAWPKKDKTYSRVTLSGGYYQRYDGNLIKSKNTSEKRIHNIDNWQDETNHLPLFGNITYEHRQKFKKIDLVFGAHYRNDQGFRKNNELQRVRINGKIRHISKKIEGLTVGLGWNGTWEGGAQFFMWSGLDSLINVPSATLVQFNDDGTPNPPIGFPELDQRTTYIKRMVALNPFITYFDKKENKHNLRFRYYNNYSTNFGYESLTTNHIYGEYTFSKELKKLGINLMAGLSSYYTHTTGETFNNKEHTAVNAGAFVQVDKKFFKKLTVSAGLRLEYNQIDNKIPDNEIPLFSLMKKNGPFYSPVKPLLRVGVNYEPIRGTFIRASYGEGHRVPTINELYVFTARGTTVLPNPDLLPESGWSAELGVKQAVKKGKWQGYFDIAGFITEYSNYIEFVNAKDPNYKLAFHAENLEEEKARISGIELSALGQGELFGVPLNFLAGYTFTSPIDLSKKTYPLKPQNNVLNYRSLHSVKADIEASYKKFTLGFATLYNSNMVNVPDVQEQFPGIASYRLLDDDGYLLFDSRIRYDISKKIKVSAIVKNMFNEQYSTRPGILENPRYYTLQYQQNF
ncbi:MAG: outer membrane cobalamin receptor [Planctomycetota bacterium]|jgi:outer membrane cobalamin receptor